MLPRLIANGRAKTSVNVFVSSPFKEFFCGSSAPKEWPLRKKLGRQLRDAHHAAWLYEDERKKVSTRKCSDEQLISDGIEQTDIVVVLLKTRAGSFFKPYPVHGTPFEILKAIVFEKPVFLYLVGDSPDPELQGYLAVLRSKVFIAKERWFHHEDEDQICHDVLSDIEVFGSRFKRPRGRSVILSGPRPEDFGGAFYENAISGMTDSGSQLDYFGAMKYVDQIPVSATVSFGRRDMRLYAEALAQCGAIHANMMRFHPAILAKRISIRLYFKLWDFVGAFSQISALSGLLQMFGHVNADACNRLALQGAESRYRRGLKELLPGVLDAGGSILMHRGLFAEAAANFDRVMKLGVETPYIVTKLTYAEGRANGPKAIARGRSFADDQILPWARAINRDLPFAIKGSARLAMWDRDYVAAISLIDEARRFCLARGLFHPLKELAELEHISTLKLGVKSH